mmetsp:Transcript_83678/g.249736  ORF Transcript_83678/g.249736 Transcript_83678/m.249736 type:complete len:1455 (+) Transcript_83678:118-4482(+)
MSSVKEALAQLRAAREGEKRTDQYVVQEPESLMKEVSEEEYQKIVKERRGEFVVGGRDLGYADGGKEIWEDGEATKQRRQEEAERQQLAAAKGSQAKQPAAAKEPPADDSHKNLLQSFQAGARGGAGEAAAVPVHDAHRQKDLDNMLEMMCSQIEASAAPDLSRRPAEQAPATSPAKRKLEVADDEGANKNAPVQKEIKVEAPPVPVKREIEDSQAMQPVLKVPVDVKRELEDSEGAQAKFTPPPAASVKSEPKIKVELNKSPVKVEAAGNTGVQLQDWLQGGSCEGVKVDLEAASVAEAMSESKSQLRLEEDGGLWFFFVDAFEDDRASPPRVYLFGKVLASSSGLNPGGYQSCCLVVDGLERSMHFLLNVPDLDDEAAAAEVATQAETEFDNYCRRNCPGVRKLRAKLKYRNYAFEKALPHGAGYLPFLKVTCDASGQMPPMSISGSTFSHVFGLNTSLLEKLLLSRRITGPSWIRLNPGSWREEAARLSFCSVELRIRPPSIFVPKKEEERRRLSEMGMPSASPPLRVMSLCMQTFQRSAQEPHEPVAIACTLHPNVSPEAGDSDRELKLGMDTWVALRRFDSRPLPRDSDRLLSQRRVEHHSSEVALLSAFLSVVQKFDPDVISGYNAYGFDLDVLGARMQHLKLQSWQKLGRLRRPKERLPRMEGRQGVGFWVGNNITAGRLVCDVLLQARDLLPKLGSYDLPNLARNQLHVSTLQTVEPESLPHFYDSAKALCDLSDVTLQSALCVVKLMHSLQILPLSRQLTNLAGNLWNSSLQNKRAERNEMLLCHEFHRKKFVVPDRESMLSKKRRMQMDGGGLGSTLDDADGQEQEPGAASGRRGKAAYSGGLVLEPKVGLYDEFVMLLDFNSLYPSIIQEHNICFTTVDRPDETQVVKCSTEADLIGKTHLPDGTTEEGVLPQVLRRLVESRRDVKSAIKSERNPQRLQTLEIRQKALKLTANSMYGCLGFQNSRFYAKPLAALITAKGREALQNTITVVQQELQLDVVYGDTDSVFVNTKTADHDQAMQAAQHIKRSVNKRYKRLEIEIDAVFARLMLLKKKKYAAIKVVDWTKKTFEREFKGLDIVRRDWCGLAKEIGELVLTKVLEEGKEDSVHWVHNYLAEKAQEMDEKRVPLERYVITKGLTKDPKDYPDAKNQPHVQVALRLMERGKAVRPGQEIAYVICEITGEGPKASLADRARHPHEFSLDPTLRVDIEWYKKQQVHPLVSRLLGPVESTDPARVAECLGMDASRFAQAAAARAAADGADVEMEYASAASADVTALFDRKVRWKEFQSTLPGISCAKCQKLVDWKQLLQPQVWEADSLDALFRCGECKEPVNPRRAQNLLTMQLRKLMKEHCEGWVQCPDENVIEKTRRVNRGQNLTSERMVLRELEFMQFLCEAEEGYSGQDRRGCRDAAKGMAQTIRWLLDCNGYNWVDCAQIFGGIFGQSS